MKFVCSHVSWENHPYFVGETPFLMLKSTESQRFQWGPRSRLSHTVGRVPKKCQGLPGPQAHKSAAGILEIHGNPANMKHHETM